MACSMTNYALLLAVFAAATCLLQPASAAGSTPSSFLGPSRGQTAAQEADTRTWEAATAAREDHLRHTLIDHLALLLLGIGEDSSSLAVVVSETEKLLSPIIAASPKNEYGNLDDESARYALHRLFMERHGWNFKIFDTDASSSQKKSNVSTIFSFQGHLPQNVQELLERQFQRHHGYGHLDLAIFAAAVEHVIFKEVPERLAYAYLASGVEFHDVITSERAKTLVDLHMIAYIRNFDFSTAKGIDMFKLVTNMAYDYTDWADTRAFFRGIEASLAPVSGKYTFSDVSRIVLQIEKEFVHWHNRQCGVLKQKLMNLETQNSGRVRLLDFYNSALYNGTEEFVETTEYLRQLGDLDESDPLEPRVIISNYRGGPNTCVASTSFYSVCCVDECADLYSHLETTIGKAEAPPSEILPVVQSLASSAMNTCRSVADTLERRLQEIAHQNNGVISLHGSEFAEWMHFVYPSECTYARMSGRARHITMDEWQAENPFQRPLATTHGLLEYSTSLSQLEFAKGTSSTGAKQEWDVSAAAAWSKLEEPVHTGSRHRLRGNKTSD